MNDKYSKFKLIDILGIAAYALMAGSCFLPFLNYTTLTNVETITYFQGNGKLILGFSILGILLIILRFFKYTFMCLGLTIGVLIYDVTFGLIDVVKSKTTVYGLRYGSYLIALGMIINLIYVIVKILIITKEYNKQYKNENYQINGANDKFQVSLESTLAYNDNDFNDDYVSSEDISSIDAEELLIIEAETKKEEFEEKNVSLSIFSDIPDIGLINTEENKTIEEQKEIKKYSDDPPPLYKLCDSCGMQINYSDDICPVCGKQF